MLRSSLFVPWGLGALGVGHCVNLRAGLWLQDLTFGFEVKGRCLGNFFRKKISSASDPQAPTMRRPHRERHSGVDAQKPENTTWFHLVLTNPWPICNYGVVDCG